MSFVFVGYSVMLGNHATHTHTTTNFLEPINVLNNENKIYTLEERSNVLISLIGSPECLEKEKNFIEVRENISFFLLHCMFSVVLFGQVRFDSTKKGHKSDQKSCSDSFYDEMKYFKFYCIRDWFTWQRYNLGCFYTKATVKVMGCVWLLQKKGS